MGIYVKKPVEIEAHQWDGTLKESLNILNWMNQNKPSTSPEEDWCGYNHLTKSIFIDTLEGRMHAIEGDWIIKGIQGEFYPCKPDIFEQTYESLDSL